MTVNWNAYWRLMRFDKPIGILLLLWPTWWALLLAGAGHPSLKNSLIFTAGVVLMRAAGCVMNDIADRDFDPHVERTRLRPLAAGELGLSQAIGAFVVLIILAFALVLLTNALTIKLAFVGAALVLTYPFFKRFTHLPQVVLGIAFGWGIPMAFAAELMEIPWAAWWLLGINTVWAVIYDTLYAMVDREDDIALGVKSTAHVGLRRFHLRRVLRRRGDLGGRDDHCGVVLCGIGGSMRIFDHHRQRRRPRGDCFQYHEHGRKCGSRAVSAVRRSFRQVGGTVGFGAVSLRRHLLGSGFVLGGDEQQMVQTNLDGDLGLEATGLLVLGTGSRGDASGQERQ